MDPADFTGEAINHVTKMNKHKGSIAQDDVAEKGNNFLKSGEKLPTWFSKLQLVRSFCMPLANKCRGAQHHLLNTRKSTNSAKSSDRSADLKDAITHILIASKAVETIPNHENVNLFPHQAKSKGTQG